MLELTGGVRGEKFGKRFFTLLPREIEIAIKKKKNHRAAAGRKERKLIRPSISGCKHQVITFRMKTGLKGGKGELENRGEEGDTRSDDFQNRTIRNSPFLPPIIRDSRDKSKA